MKKVVLKTNGNEKSSMFVLNFKYVIFFSRKNVRKSWIHIISVIFTLYTVHLINALYIFMCKQTVFYIGMNFFYLK